MVKEVSSREHGTIAIVTGRRWWNDGARRHDGEAATTKPVRHSHGAETIELTTVADLILDGIELEPTTG